LETRHGARRYAENAAHPLERQRRRSDDRLRENHSERARQAEEDRGAVGKALQRMIAWTGNFSAKLNAARGISAARSGAFVSGARSSRFGRFYGGGENHWKLLTGDSARRHPCHMAR